MCIRDSDYLDPLVLAQLPEDLPYVAPDLVVDHFAPILRREPVSYTHLDVYKRQVVMQAHLVQPYQSNGKAPLRGHRAPRALSFAHHCLSLIHI